MTLYAQKGGFRLWMTIAASLAATTAAAENTIVFSPQSLAVPAFRGLSEGLGHIGEGAGVEIINVDPNFDAATQAQQLDQLIRTGRVQAAWVIAVKTDALKPVIALAAEKGVAMVLNGKPADYGFDAAPAGITFSDTDQSLYGGAVGRMTGTCIAQKLSGAGKVIFMRAQAGSSGRDRVEAALLEQLALAAPDAEIIAETEVVDRVGAQTQVGQILQAHPDANAVMTTNDENTLGALGAFQAAGKEVPCLVGGGGSDEVIERVGTGEIHGAVAFDFMADTMQTFEILMAAMANPGSAGQQRFVPIKEVTVQP